LADDHVVLGLQQVVLFGERVEFLVEQLQLVEFLQQFVLLQFFVVGLVELHQLLVRLQCFECL